MLPTDMNMRAPDRSLEDRPEAFKGVHMNVAPRIFLGHVFDRFMPIPKASQDAVRNLAKMLKLI